ncbi:MAG: TonB-dependent receptor P3 [Parabacteroides sp.]
MSRFILTAALSTFCLFTYAQQQRVNLSGNNLTLKAAFKQIEQQTKLFVDYKVQEVNDSRIIRNVPRENNVKAVLEQLLDGTGCSVVFKNGHIIITKQTGQASDKTTVVTGVVKTESGEPIIGANVVEKGTTNGTVTDINGKYSLTVPKGSVLQVSYIGYNTQELSSNGKPVLNIVLKEDLKALDEVVVVGYGTQKKEVVTAAITTVKSDQIAVSPSSDVAAGLAGRLSGVIINTRSGEVGNESTSIFVRGRSTYGGSTEPLYVVDGIARTEEDGLLSRIDPNDIESISVLKDASAAIYGSRAANGVILITTKRGVTGMKPTINITYNHSFAQPSRIVKMADAATYATAHNWANQSKGLDPTYSPEEIQKFADGSDPLNYPNTDWYRTVQKTWTHQDKANISLRGGSEKVQYFMSGGILNQGTPFNNGFTYNRQFNVRSNLDAKVNNYIKVGLDISAKKLDRVLPRDGSVNGGSMYSHVALNLPTILAKYPGTDLAAPARDGDNPLVQTSGEAGYTKTNRWILNSQANITIDIPWVKGLSLNGSFAYDYYHQKYKQFKNVAYVYNYDQATDVYSKVIVPTVTSPSLTVEEKRTESITGNVRINYRNTFAELHTLDGFLGFEENKFNSNMLNGYRGNFPSGALDELPFGDSNTQTNSGSYSETARLNYFGRLLYDFDNKYMLQFQFRYDGSQNFPKGNRFGFFPGVSAGWTITREKFMENVNWLDNLKLRASWGMMGNDAVAAYQYLVMYGLASGAVFNGSQASGLYQKGTPNPNITWETATSYDVGLEARFLGGRLGFEVDWFKSRREDILAKRNASVPAFTGLSLPDENIGIAENNGFEFMINHQNTIKKDFSYSISGNFTLAKNKVVFSDEVPMAEEYQKSEGHPIGSSLRYKAIGIYSEADINDPSVPKRPGTMAGDIKIWDANGDGDITSLDQIRQDLTDIPQIVYGLNLGFTWKQFDIALMFQGQARVINTINDAWVDPSSGGAGNLMEWWTEDMWTPENPDGTKPRLGTPNRIGGTTFTNISAAFFKLKNAEIGYTLPNTVKSKLGVENARIYISGTNLFSLDHMHNMGIDPEATGAGYGGWALNPQRLINLGINISF